MNPSVELRSSSVPSSLHRAKNRRGNKVRTGAEFSSLRFESSFQKEIVRDYYETLNTPTSLACWMLYKYQEHDQLAEKSIHARSYNCADSFRDDYAAVSFLSKDPSLRTTFNRKERAISSFLDGESRCRSVNNRVLSSIPTTIGMDEGIISDVRRKIEKILGEVTITEVFDEARWGPGSTFSTKGEDAFSSHKYTVDCDITADARDLYGPSLIAYAPFWLICEKRLSIVKGCRIHTVPKNAKTDRTIAIEPGINSWIQLGLGSVIRKRLRKHGYNLNSDFRNQAMARLGSLFGTYATVDFKAASDSIARRVVELLLPPRWFRMLDSARSHFFSLDGGDSWILSEKFSTMGNGFTFELESLIFVALAEVVLERSNLERGWRLQDDISIFGDDVVLPSSVAAEYVEVARTFGFEANVEKTFASTYFRESCGSYFFNGVDVKPVYKRESLRTGPALYSLHNRIVDFARREYCYMAIAKRFSAILSRLEQKVPKHLRMFGPPELGDCVLTSDSLDLARHPKGWDGYICPAFLTRAWETVYFKRGHLLAKLRSLHQLPTIEDETLEHVRPYPNPQDKEWDVLLAKKFLSSGNRCSLRGRTFISFKRVFVRQLRDFGPRL